MQTEGQAIDLEDLSRLARQRRGGFRFNFDLWHRAVMQRAREERKQLMDELRSCGVNPDQVLFEHQIARQTPATN